MESLRNLLADLGLGVSGNFIYDLIKSLASKPASRDELLQNIQNCLRINGVQMRADDVISALAKDGFLRIENSNLSAGGALVFGAAGGHASFGNNSSLRNNGAVIVAQGNSSVEASGHAQIRQEGGCITIHVGQPETTAPRKTL
jgi:hypothetical protein